MAYYTNINPDLLARIPSTARYILEVGCGAGQLGYAYKARNPQVRYLGIEISESAAHDASTVLDHVIGGDIEQPQVFVTLDQVRNGTLLDTLIFGDVLEHLREPLRVLADLRDRVSPGGVCIACIPNVAHWSVVQQQLSGRWDYTESGLLDRTHLRFFTLDTAIELFQKAGWTVLDASPRVLWPDKTEEAVKIFATLSETLGIAPQNLRRNLSAFQWIIRAINGSLPARLSVAGLGLRKQAGVNEPRIDHPMAALASLPGMRVVWGAHEVSIPTDWPPGIFVLHRQFMIDVQFKAYIERMIAKGWCVVLDMDDDPRHWKEFVESDFYAFRAVHAVTVSVDQLAEIVSQWNPNVQVLHNAIFELPQVSPTTPKQGERLRVFFGALNRSEDWGLVREGFVAAGEELGDAIEFVVVHDRAFFDALPGRFTKEFHPTLPHGEYMQVLAGCDVALLPLADTPFNHLKSDLKFIECCAAGVVPICSPVVYDGRAEHREIGLFATTGDEWRRAIVSACTDRSDLVRRRAMGLAYVKRERMHSQQVKMQESFYRDLLARREDIETQRRERLSMCNRAW